MNNERYSPDLLAWLERAGEPPQRALIPYTPISDLIEGEWDSSAELLLHLLYYPADRERLLTEAKRRYPHTSTMVYITHPLLGRQLAINSDATDKIFKSVIQNLLGRIAQIQRLHKLQEDLNARLPPQYQPKDTNPPRASTSLPASLPPKPKIPSDHPCVSQ